MAQEFEGRRRGELMDSLANLSGAETNSTLELTVKRNKRRVTVGTTMFRAAGDRLFIGKPRQTD